MSTGKHFNYSYKIGNILMMSCDFSRSAGSALIEKAPNILVNIDTQVFEGNLISTELTLVLKHEDKKVDNETLIELTIKFLGIFEFKEKAPDDVLIKFGRVNGSAMMFPYLRETVSAVYSRASLSPIFIPPYNFVEAYNKYIEDTEIEAAKETSKPKNKRLP